MWCKDNVPDASVIIVNWNTRAYVLQCLKSLSDQMRPWNIEIIVVDNASSDGSVRAIKEQFPTVRIIENTANTGFATANNLGILESRGRYLLLINSDVTLRPRCLDRLLRFMDHHTRIGLLGPRILNADLTLQKSVRAFPTVSGSLCRALMVDRLYPISALLPTGERFKVSRCAQAVDILSGCFWVVRRATLDDVGLLDETFFMYAEDKDWCIRFWASNWQVVYLPTAEAIHFGGSSSARAPTRFYIEEHRANLRYWEKHHGRMGRNCVYCIMILHQLVRILTGLAMYCVRPQRRPMLRAVIDRCFACARYLLGADLSRDQEQHL